MTNTLKFQSPSLPLQKASPRLPAPRYHHPSKPRRALLENIEELLSMFAVLGTLQASTQTLLAVAPSASMAMITTHEQIVLNAFSYGVLHLAQEAVGMYFQRQQLGAESSGGMLVGAARGHWGPLAKASEWAMFLAARILVTLMHFRATHLGWWAIFGDSAFQFGPYSFRMTQQACLGTLNYTYAELGTFNYAYDDRQGLLLWPHPRLPIPRPLPRQKRGCCSGPGSRSRCLVKRLRVVLPGYRLLQRHPQRLAVFSRARRLAAGVHLANPGQRESATN